MVGLGKAVVVIMIRTVHVHEQFEISSLTAKMDEH